MRFAALQGGGVSDYAAAGKKAANAAAESFSITRKHGPNYDDIAQTGMKARSAEKITAMQTGAQVTKAGIAAVANVTKTQIQEQAKIDARKARTPNKMAGGIAAIGKAAAAGFLMRDNDKRKPPSNLDAKKELINSWQKERDAKTAKRDAARTDYKPIEQMEAVSPTAAKQSDTPNPSSVPNEPAAPASVSTPTAGNAGKVDKGVPYSLSGNRKTLADAVAKYESGDWGYEAFNQGGAANGRRVLGKRGSHKEQFGTSLTDMSLSEIFHRQNTEQRGLSMQQHLDSGGLHAVGRYQFIGSTLQDEVSRMGISHDTKFTPEIQDKIFFNHIKRVGNLSPWVGPNDKYNSSQKRQFESMIRQL